MSRDPIEERAFLGGRLLALEMVVSIMLNRLGMRDEVIEAAERQLDLMHATQVPADAAERKRFLQRIKVAGLALGKLRGDGRP